VKAILPAQLGDRLIFHRASPNKVTPTERTARCFVRSPNMVAAWTSGLENLAVNGTQLLRYLAQRFDRLNMLGVRQCAGESGAQDGPGQSSRLRRRSPRV